MNKKLLLLSLLQYIANCFSVASKFHQQNVFGSNNGIVCPSILQNLIGLSYFHKPAVKFSSNYIYTNINFSNKLSR